MTTSSPLVWCAGVAWDDPAGTDRRIVEAIAVTRPVHWVDPPRFRIRPVAETSTEVPGVTRHRVWATPASTRGGVAAATRALHERAVGRILAATGADTVVVANPLATFPAVPVRRVLYVTDDWEAGAELMGLSRALIADAMRRTRAAADAVIVVSPALARSRRDVVLPNGGPAPTTAPPVRREATAVLIGQLNERLDMVALEALASAGIPVRVVGRSVVRDPRFGQRLEAWLSQPTVDWRGAVPAAEVPQQLADAAVGITPYADTAFNRASSPLKTFDYLAAGLPVVSSALPASRWLDSPHVSVAETSADFVAAVSRAIAQRHDSAPDRARREFSASHTWERRAETFLSVADGRAPQRIGGAR